MLSNLMTGLFLVPLEMICSLVCCSELFEKTVRYSQIETSYKVAIVFASLANFVGLVTGFVLIMRGFCD